METHYNKRNVERIECVPGAHLIVQSKTISLDSCFAPILEALNIKLFELN